jgi:hypothetical protein
MSPIRKLLFVGVGVLALHGVQACANETELNPQPLPPQTVNDPGTQPPDKNGTTGTSGGGGTSGSSGATPAADADADAGDGGTDGGDGGDQ